MEFDHNSYIHLIFISFVALFPVVNPIGSSFIVNPYFINMTFPQKKKRY
jgi:multiple antibiotic resistance protein